MARFNHINRNNIHTNMTSSFNLTKILTLCNTLLLIILLVLELKK